MPLPPEKFRVGLVQMSAAARSRQNLQTRHGRSQGSRGRAGAQVVCLPELFQTQYFCQREDQLCSI